MKKSVISSVFILFTLTSFAQKNAFDYFGLTSPGNEIELFAPGIISLEDSTEFSLAISPSGDEVFFANGTWPESKIMHVKKEGSQWSKPEVATFCLDCYAAEPAFSPDGKYLYFSSSKNMEDIKEYAIWRVEKVNNEWVNAKKVIDIEEPGIWEFHPSITNEGTVYFCYWDSKINMGKIYQSEYVNDTYAEPKLVDLLFEGECSVTNPLIDPAGKFIVTATQTENSKSGYDVFISYRDQTGWSQSVRFGDRLNTPEDNDSFDVSPDGRMIFIYKEGDVYWTEACGILE